jgi:hypothetical protein
MGKQRAELIGTWEIVLQGPDGSIKERRSGENVITTVGKEMLASYLLSATTSGANTLKHIAIGTGSTAEAAGDTALGTELARTTGTVTYTSGAIYEVLATFPAGTGTGAIAEYGLFNTASVGTLFSRDTETVINKGAGDILTVTTKVTLS